MTLAETLAELEQLGTAQTRKTYRRHGAPTPLFGVSYADLGKLTKRIKRDQALADGLWASGNTDARILATMIADPAAFSVAKIEAWLEELAYGGIIDELVKRIAAPNPAARAMMERWTASDDEWIGRAGYTLLSQLAADEASTSMVPEALFEERLATIEAGIHGAKNRKRQAMNLALVSVGSRNARLRELAMAAATRLGPIAIDHGDTDCKTVDAVSYIEKMWARKNKAAPAAKTAPSAAKKSKKK